MLTAPTTGSFLSGIAGVAAGEDHSLAVTTDGKVYAWGYNYYGELGIGYNNNQFGSIEYPVQVIDPTDPTGYLTGVVAVAAGYYQSLALKSNGTVVAWGYNGYGQLGNGDRNYTDRFVPVTVAAVGSPYCSDQSTNPTVNPGLCTGATALSGITAIAAGYAHNMALGPNGAVYTWGGNYDGQLGNGDRNEYQQGVPVRVVAPGTALCAQPDPYADPVIPSTCPAVSYLTGATAIDTSEDFSLALGGDSTVLSWGYNGYAALGNGDTDYNDQGAPVRVVAVGTATCAQPDPYADPVGPNTCPAVITLNNVVAIAAGGDHALALKNDGTVVSWGANYSYQLGNGSLVDDEFFVPRQVVKDASGTPLANVVAIDSGYETSFAITIDPPTPIQQFTVTASKTGSGTVSDEGAKTYNTGTEASYTATAAAGQTFIGWTLDGTYVGYANPLKFTVTANRTLVAAFVATPTFSDLGTLSPQDQQAITFLAALGIVNPNGVNGSGQFQPDGNVKRAEIAAFVARTFGWDNEFHSNTFPDKCDANNINCIDDELWNNVAALRDYGVVGGYTDPITCEDAGTTAPCYLPRDTVKRVQVVSVVARAFIKNPGLRPTGFWDRQDANNAQYTNVPNVGTQRSDLTTYRANVGTVPGQTSDAAFGDPNGNGSRLYTVQILYAAFNAQFGVDRVP